MKSKVLFYSFLVLFLSVVTLVNGIKAYAIEIKEETIDQIKSEVTAKVNQTTEIISENKGIFEKIWEAIKEFFISIFKGLTGVSNKELVTGDDLKEKVSTDVQEYVATKASDSLKNVFNGEGKEINKEKDAIKDIIVEETKEDNQNTEKEENKKEITTSNMNAE